MRKFAIGDEVVSVRSERGMTILNWDMPLYTKGVVVGSEYDGDFLRILFDSSHCPEQTISSQNFDEIELLSIYESPLWKALS